MAHRIVREEISNAPLVGPPDMSLAMLFAGAIGAYINRIRPPNLARACVYRIYRSVWAGISDYFRLSALLAIEIGQSPIIAAPPSNTLVDMRADASCILRYVDPIGANRIKKRWAPRRCL